MRGKSGKGKNRVRERGDKWLVRQLTPNCMALDGADGIFIHPVAMGDETEWDRIIALSDDRDFDIVGVNE